MRRKAAPYKDIDGQGLYTFFIKVAKITLLYLLSWYLMN